MATHDSCNCRDRTNVTANHGQATRLLPQLSRSTSAAGVIPVLLTFRATRSDNTVVFATLFVHVGRLSDALASLM
jgi:hypothetical protein